IARQQSWRRGKILGPAAVRAPARIVDAARDRDIEDGAIDARLSAGYEDHDRYLLTPCPADERKSCPPYRDEWLVQFAPLMLPRLTLLREGAFREGTFEGRSRGRCPRAEDMRSAPGRLWVPGRPAKGPVRTERA